MTNDELLASALAAIERQKADIATLREHLDRQSAHLHTAWAERDKARAALAGLLPFVTGPEDEDSPGYAEALAAAQKAAEGGV